MVNLCEYRRRRVSPSHLLHQHPSGGRMGGGRRQHSPHRAGAQGAAVAGRPVRRRDCGSRRGRRASCSKAAGSTTSERFSTPRVCTSRSSTAFPYGPFHGTPVKAKVYAPDWRDEARVAYTLDLIEILGRLLPADLDGGVSTAPLSYKPWIRAGRRRGVDAHRRERRARRPRRLAQRPRRARRADPPRHRAGARLPARNHGRDGSVLRRASGHAGASRARPRLFRLLSRLGRTRGSAAGARARTGGPESRSAACSSAPRSTCDLPGDRGAAARASPPASVRSPIRSICTRWSNSTAARRRQFPRSRRRAASDADAD